MNKIAAATLGCKLNQYETSCIVDDFLLHGWEAEEFDQPADVYLINSCTVTNRTDFKSRNAIRRALKMKQITPAVKIVVTGCYAQRNAEEIRKLGAIDLIIDNNSKNLIYEAVTANLIPEFQDILKVSEYSEHSTSRMLENSRAFIKIQDGCDYFCAYCAVAWARGASRSRERENILEQVRQLCAQGYREFVISGVNLGLYGREKQDGYYLENLLSELEEINGVEKIRLSSLEPQLVTEPLLNQIRRSEKICPHFHLALQSGSDSLLLAMGRNYTQAEFKEILGKIYLIRPFAAIGLDVIAGLPGETEELFNETYALLQNLPITYLHVFPYSRRPGTPASSMPAQVHGSVSRMRVELLLKLSEQKKAEYIQKLIKDKIVLGGIVENRQDEYYTLLSDHYIRAYLPEGNHTTGDLVEGRAVSQFRDGVLLEVSK
jgi:threonylcarbamoyladenosine tRNA methylthiotransferase MtaB